jgi:hypothetical protein
MGARLSAESIRFDGQSLLVFFQFPFSGAGDWFEISGDRFVRAYLVPRAVRQPRLAEPAISGRPLENDRQLVIAFHANNAIEEFRNVRNSAVHGEFDNTLTGRPFGLPLGIGIIGDTLKRAEPPCVGERFGTSTVHRRKPDFFAVGRDEKIAPGLKRAAIMFNPDTAPLSVYMPSFEAF